MTRGRKASLTPEALPDTVDRAVLASANSALTVMGSRSSEIAERFGDGQPYERSRVISEAKFFMAQSAEAMLELGKRLIQIKENEPFGDFTEIVTERLGMTARSAQLMMQASVKYLSPALESKAKSISLLGKSKLFDLMTESDDDLAELAEGGTLAGHTLPEMAGMTRRELQAALAEKDKQLAAKDKVLAKKDQKLNKLAEAAELRGAIGTDEAATLQGLRDATVAAEIALAQLGATVGAALNVTLGEAVNAAARHAGEYIAQRLASLLLEHGVPVSFEEMLEPIHLGTAAPAAKRR